MVVINCAKKMFIDCKFYTKFIFKKKKNVLHNEIDVKLFALSHKNVKQKKESLILQIFF